jgi:hypothetical protein
MHLRNQRFNVVQSRGKFSTSSPTTAPEMLATEVTPGLLAGAEPDAHQFMSRFVYGRGDRMEVNSDDIVSTPKLGPTCMGR